MGFTGILKNSSRTSYFRLIGELVGEKKIPVYTFASPHRMCRMPFKRLMPKAMKYRSIKEDLIQLPTPKAIRLRSQAPSIIFKHRLDQRRFRSEHGITISLRQTGQESALL